MLTRKQAEGRVSDLKNRIAYGVKNWIKLTPERQAKQSYYHGCVDHLVTILQCYEKLEKAIAVLKKYDDENLGGY